MWEQESCPLDCRPSYFHHCLVTHLAERGRAALGDLGLQHTDKLAQLHTIIQVLHENLGSHLLSWKRERSLLYILKYRIIFTHLYRAQCKNSLPYLVFSSSLKRSRSHNKSLFSPPFPLSFVLLFKKIPQWKTSAFQQEPTEGIIAFPRPFIVKSPL